MKIVRIFRVSGAEKALVGPGKVCRQVRVIVGSDMDQFLGFCTLNKRHQHCNIAGMWNQRGLFHDIVPDYPRSTSRLQSEACARHAPVLTHNNRYRVIEIAMKIKVMNHPTNRTAPAATKRRSTIPAAARTETGTGTERGRAELQLGQLCAKASFYDMHQASRFRETNTGSQ